MSENENRPAEPAVDPAPPQHRPPFQASRKIYVAGSRHDLRVPMREIAQTPHHHPPTGDRCNPSIVVYDSTGPYTDPEAQIDIRRGLAPLRADWIAERDDTAPLDGPSSEYGRRRAADPALSPIRFPAVPTPPPRPWRWLRDPTPLRAQGDHHPGDGIYRHPRKPASRSGGGRSRPLRVSIPGRLSGRHCRAKLPPSSSGMKSPWGAPSSRPTSTTRSWSR